MVPPGQTRVIFSSQAVVFQAYCKFTFDGDPELVRGTYSHEDAAGSDTRLLLQARVLEDAGPAVDTLLVTPPFNKVDPGNFGCQAQNLSNAAVEVKERSATGSASLSTPVPSPCSPTTPHKWRPRRTMSPAATVPFASPPRLAMCAASRPCNRPEAATRYCTSRQRPYLSLDRRELRPRPGKRRPLRPSRRPDRPPPPRPEGRRPVAAIATATVT